MKQNQNKTIYPLLALTIVGISTIPEKIFASTSIQIAKPDSNLSLTSSNLILDKIFGQIYTLLVYIVGATAVIFTIWAGINYITSIGDTKKSDEAKKTLINVFTGVVITTSTYAIIRLAVAVGNYIIKGL